MRKQKSNVVAILDIGSSKIICLIAKIWGRDRYEVIGVSHKASVCMRAGVISDMQAMEKTIQQAVYEAEAIARERISGYYISISPNCLLSRRTSSRVSVAGHEITYKDINKILFDVLEQYKKQNLEVVHSFPYEYTIDGNGGVTTPLGMYGDELLCNMHIISGTSNNLLNLARCLSKCTNNIDGYIASTYAAGLASLTDDEMNVGVTMLEFGAGTTSISMFEHGQMIYTDAIPIVGLHITNDIARCLCTSTMNAERIKNLYGGVVSTDSDVHEIIEVLLSDENDITNISRELLIDIIRARIEELIEMIISKVEESDVQPPRKVVIAGGGARLSGLKELLSHVLNTRVRVAYSIKDIPGLEENNLEFATAAGMLLHIAQNHKSTGSMGGESMLRKVWQAFHRHFTT